MTSVIGEGLKEFTEQLTDDTDDVRKEVTTRAEIAKEKLRNVQEQVGSANVMGALSDVPGRISERMDGASLDGVMRTVETKLVQAEGSASALIARGVEKLQRSIDDAGGGGDDDAAATRAHDRPAG